jgi:hypothetical protein
MPTKKDIRELVSFLPKLYADGFKPVKKWGGGQEESPGVFIIPWPDYESIVDDFFALAAQDCWADYHYLANDASEMLTAPGVIENADLNQIKTMLTFCVRGERFCMGHWGEMIEKEYIRRLLLRLSELTSS